MKNWYQSKTVWIAILTIAVGILSFIQANPQIGVLATVIGSLNIILRFATTTSIK
jgi:hypothetical protein